MGTGSGASRSQRTTARPARPTAFFGVELTAKEAHGTVVRVLRDPVRGTLIVVERGGGKPIVLSPEECTTLQVQVTKTNTSINDVWVVEGSARVDCPELNGSVTFDGCH